MKHITKLFLLSENDNNFRIYKPLFDALNEEGLETDLGFCTEVNVDNYSTSDKVFFTLLALQGGRLSNFFVRRDLNALVEKLGMNNVYVLIINPAISTEPSNGEYYAYEGLNLRCFYLQYNLETQTFSKSDSTNIYTMNEIKKICPAQISRVNNIKLNPLFTYGALTLACATAIGIVVLCSKKPEILTNFKELISKLCSSISEVFTGR